VAVTKARAAKLLLSLGVGPVVRSGPARPWVGRGRALEMVGGAPIAPTLEASQSRAPN
jgi:hypothetical protein